MNLRCNFLFKIFLVTVFVLFVGITSYYYIGFQPYKSAIKGMILGAHPLHVEPSVVVSDLIVLSEKKNQILNYVVLKLLSKFKPKRSNMLWWHVEGRLWSFLLNACYSERDLLTLWLIMARYEKGSGFNESANYHYGRNMDQLSIEELATLTIIAKNPSFYSGNPEKLEKMVLNLIERYKSVKGS